MSEIYSIISKNLQTSTKNLLKKIDKSNKLFIDLRQK
jgi:hypothetical protein